MHEDIKIVRYPDPRLKKRSLELRTIDPATLELAARMFQLMRENQGVGLAAPQVGRNIRLFVMNATGNPEDDRIYINPVVSEAEGEDEASEGCLSIPKLNVNIWRSVTLRLQAMDQHGNPVDVKETGFVARVWQHEIDHLDGVLITDKMTPVAKIANRKLLKDLEAEYEALRDVKQRRA
jgi:peptide deformylase